jgi:hypothetical protein
MEVAEWLERYRAAWEGANPSAAAALFTEDAVYWSTPFREAHEGRDGIRDYWARATGTQVDPDVRFGRPISEGRRTAVEWWATMRDDEGEVTLAGILFLRFASDGLCEELRETWMVGEGRLGPHPGWGT